jgi:hypothetical protein
MDMGEWYANPDAVTQVASLSDHLQYDNSGNVTQSRLAEVPD